MTNLANIPTQDGYETALSQEMSTVATSFTVNTAPTYTPTTTDTYVVINPGKSNQEVVLCTSYVAATKTFNVTTRAISMALGVTATAQTHAAGSKVIISDNFAFWSDIQTAINTKIDGLVQGVYFYADETARNAALGASPANSGLIAGLTTEGKITYSLAGSWLEWSTTSSTFVNASTTVAGKVEEATAAEQGAGTGTGGTGARLFVNPSNLVKTSSGAGDENKVPVLNSSGKLADGFQSISAANGTTLTASTTSDASALHTHGSVAGTFKWGGTGADGAIGSGALTITGSNNTYIVKNYTSFAPGANTVTVTPTNCVVHFRISGNCDLTGTTFSFSGKGGPGGTAGSGGNGGVGTNGLSNSVVYSTGGNCATPAAGVAPLFSTATLADLTAGRQFVGFCGAGGSGGGSGTGGGTPGAGGVGGAGGGCLILEVAGNVTLSGTVATFTGAVGGNGVAGSGGGGDGRGGGGGGGGTFVILYGGTASGSLTPTVTGGAGGTSGGAGTANNAGAGGASATASGALGNVGTGAGGAGGAGQFLIAKNTFFS